MMVINAEHAYSYANKNVKSTVLILLTVLRIHAYQNHQGLKKAHLSDCTDKSPKLQLIREDAYLTILLLFRTHYLLLYVSIHTGSCTYAILQYYS